MEGDLETFLQAKQIGLLQEILKETKKSSFSTDKLNNILVCLTVGGFIYAALTLLWDISPLKDQTQIDLLVIGIGIVYFVIAVVVISTLRKTFE
jgi:hypothetical protein